MRRRVISLLVLTAALVGTACGGDDSSSGKGPDSTPGLLPDPSYNFGPTTTFMSDCAVMPTPEELSAIVGIPLDIGAVIATGTCEFRGVNDQNRVVTLSQLTDAADIAAFNDLVMSVGTTTPLTDAPVDGMFIAPDHRIGIIVDGAIYIVESNITDRDGR